MFTYTAIITKVVDGDTFKLDIDLGFGIWRRGERYRFARINAPEHGTPAGDAATAALTKLLAGIPSITIISTKADNYGRYLVEVILPDGTNVNDWMVSNGFAVKYG